MSNYEVIEIDQIEDPITHFALFLYGDPIALKRVVKESTCKKAMDDEIIAI